MGLQLPSCAIMFYQRVCIVLLVRNGQERSNLSKSLHCQACRGKKKVFFFFLNLGHRENERWVFRARGQTSLVWTWQQGGFCDFFVPPAACYFGIIKESFPRYHIQPHWPCFYLREVGSQNWDLELLNGLSFFYLWQIYFSAARNPCLKNERRRKKII